MARPSLGRFLFGVLLAIVIPLALIFQALFVGDLLGVYPADFEHLTTVRILAGRTGASEFLWTQLGFAVMEDSSTRYRRWGRKSGGAGGSFHGCCAWGPFRRF